MDYIKQAQKIIALKKADLELREKLVESGKLWDGYNAEMEKMHNRNANLLQEIIHEIGYPTVDKVGQEASEAAWLVIQHSISKPQFMKACCELLKTAVDEKKADPKNLAGLSDRIAVFEGRAQLYGTSFDWDENGDLSPNLYDDLEKVNERRAALGLNSLEEQTLLMRQRAADENEVTPEDIQRRKQEMDAWRIKVGWI